MPIALICADAHFGEQETLRQYRLIQLTAAELRDVLTFAFPPVRPETLTVNYASVIVHCACGEDTPETITNQPVGEVECICGRRWQITMTEQLVADPHPPLS